MEEWILFHFKMSENFITLCFHINMYYVIKLKIFYQLSCKLERPFLLYNILHKYLI